VHAGLRKTLGKTFAALLIMSGGALLVVGAALQAVAPGPSPGEPKPGPVAGVHAYSSAFIQDVLYGALVHWDPAKVQAARGLGAGVAGLLPASETAAKALVGDQVAYMDWLLACHDVLDGSMDNIEAGAFGAAQDSLMQGVASCRDGLLGLVMQVRANAATFPGYGYASIPRYDAWEKAAFATARQIDLQAALAIDAISPYSAYFHGSAAPGFASMASVEALLATKTVTAPLGTASSEAAVLASDKVDASSAVAFWLRHAQALGETGLRLELAYSGLDAKVCAATTSLHYCALGGGTTVLSVARENATYNAHGLSVFSAANPSDEEEWGLIVRNGAANATAELTLEAACSDGSLTVQWTLPSIPSQSSAFTSHPFDDDVACPALLHIRSPDGAFLLARTGEIAGGFGFTI
jgi:hypothetical protein